MDVSIVLSLTALIFGVLGLCLGIYSIIQLEAQKRSTHTIEWRPLDVEQPVSKAAKSPTDQSKDLYNKGFAPSDPLENYDDEEMI